MDLSADIAALSLEDIDSVSSVGRDRDTVGPLPRPVMPSWGMPYAPARPYAPSYLSPLSYGPPAAATPYNFVNDSVSYVSMPGMNGAESVVSGERDLHTVTTRGIELQCRSLSNNSGMVWCGECRFI